MPSPWRYQRARRLLLDPAQRWFCFLQPQTARSRFEPNHVWCNCSVVLNRLDVPNGNLPDRDASVEAGIEALP
jgi:hypothetical protein